MAVCKVKGRPGCTVNCPGKCIAYYPEPLGPCIARCIPSAGSTKIKIEPTERLSICMNGLTGRDVIGVFDLSIDADSRSALANAPAIFDMDASDITGSEFVQRLLSAMGGRAEA